MPHSRWRVNMPFVLGTRVRPQVSDKITVESKNNDDGQVWAWESELGSSQYNIRESDGAPPAGPRPLAPPGRCLTHERRTVPPPAVLMHCPCA